MLIELKVANFMCFRDEVTLSLQPAGKDAMLRGNIWQGHRYRALKSAAIFGSNASGKTSLLHALYVLRRFVENSATKMNVGDRIPGVSPFRLSTRMLGEPSAFEVLVELDGVGYRYRVEATAERVLRERLECQDRVEGARWLTLIDRGSEPGNAVLHERMGTQARRDQIGQDTRDNALILSRAAERNVDVVIPLFEWFSKQVNHLNAGAGSSTDALKLRSIAHWTQGHPQQLAHLSDLVRDADTGIVRMGTEASANHWSLPFWRHADSLLRREEVDSSGFLTVPRVTKQRMLSNKRRRTRDGERARHPMQFFAEHRASGGEPVRFDLADESAGTRRYLLLAGRMLQHCASADLLTVDEMHTSLHPQLARRVVEMAHSPEFGRAGAQLLFTTHDTTMLDPDLLRRDQIVLTQKDADGAAEVYSLWDFDKMPRNKAAWGRNYLAGRFGGVPVFGPSLADIPQADEPTPVQPSSSDAPEDE
jgi:hypothetical protein